MPAKFDHRTFVRMDHGLPEHPKFADLPDRAFRVWFECVCWSSRQERDGHIPQGNAKRLGLTGKALRDLLDVVLVEVTETGYYLHDYLDFQRSKEEIEAFRAGRGAAGDKGNHQRWHVARRKWDKDCDYCNEEGRLAIAK